MEMSTKLENKGFFFSRTNNPPKRLEEQESDSNLYDKVVWLSDLQQTGYLLLSINTILLIFRLHCGNPCVHGSFVRFFLGILGNCLFVNLQHKAPFSMSCCSIDMNVSSLLQTKAKEPASVWISWVCSLQLLLRVWCGPPEEES